MRRPETPEVIFSSLFFLLAVFSMLVIGLSRYAMGFSQLLALVSVGGGIYEWITVALLGAGSIGAFYFFILSVKKEELSWKYKTLMVCIGLLFLGAAIFELRESNLFKGLGTQEILMIFKEGQEAIERTVPWSEVRYLFDGVFYISFLFLPLLFWHGSIEFDKSDSLGHILHTLRPRLNVIIAMNFGYCIQSYFFSSWWGAVDTTLLILALALLWSLVYRKKHLVGFYESFNLFLLVILLLLCVLSRDLLASVMEHYAMRKTFYALAIFGWAMLWMEKVTRHAKHRH